MLVEKFKQKDEKAFEKSYNMYHKSMLGVMRDFGITLELAGGSESPTIDQLYTLGVVSR